MTTSGRTFCAFRFWDLRGEHCRAPRGRLPLPTGKVFLGFSIFPCGSSSVSGSRAPVALRRRPDCLERRECNGSGAASFELFPLFPDHFLIVPARTEPSLSGAGQAQLGEVLREPAPLTGSTTGPRRRCWPLGRQGDRETRKGGVRTRPPGSRAAAARSPRARPPRRTAPSLFAAPAANVEGSQARAPRACVPFLQFSFVLFTKSLHVWRMLKQKLLAEENNRRK